MLSLSLLFAAFMLSDDLEATEVYCVSNKLTIFFLRRSTASIPMDVIYKVPCETQVRGNAFEMQRLTSWRRLLFA